MLLYIFVWVLLQQYFAESADWEIYYPMFFFLKILDARHYHSKKKQDLHKVFSWSSHVKISWDISTDVSRAGQKTI